MSFESFKDLILEKAERFGYDSALLAAQIWKESGFNPLAQSWAGAQGLIQIMPATWRGMQRLGWVSYSDSPTDPDANLEGGVRLMAQLLQRYRNASSPVQLALAAYNAGYPRVDKAIKARGRTDWAGVKSALPYQTQAYVPAILGRVAQYRWLMDRGY
ncbi:MAG TPA: lytic transglycosylase domain-containing protein [Holophaga sp.]|nr:lytic transglycosylase domain-containing protein [Holophaga sp.]